MSEKAELNELQRLEHIMIMLKVRAKTMLDEGHKIVCDSIKGQGTTFTILMPAYDEPVKKEMDRIEILR